MKKSELTKLIKECHLEILNEATNKLQPKDFSGKKIASIFYKKSDLCWVINFEDQSYIELCNNGEFIGHNKK